MRNKLTQDKPTLFVDQYGDRVVARNARELREKCGGGRLFKVYRDKTHGGTSRTVWIGYGVGRRWFEAFKPVEVAE